MNTVSLETAVFGGYAIAAVAFCLGYVTARVMALRERRELQAAPPTAVRVTGTARPSRWPTEPTNTNAPDSRPRCACGYVRCICTGDGTQ